MTEKMPTVRRGYQALLSEIAELYAQTRASVVKMYWEIGKRIVEVEQAGDERADYGKRLLPRLSADLTKRFGAGFSLSSLHRMKALYLQNKIFAPARKLTWAHQVELMTMPDVKMRWRLAQQVESRDLSRDELRELIQRHRPAELRRADW